MKQITLTQGKVAIVDDADYEHLNKFKWYAKLQNGIWYACRTQKTIRMHREIMKCPDDKEVDHVDHDGLNNQRHNLRICDPVKNNQNRRSRKNSSSQFLGVSINKWLTKDSGRNGRPTTYYPPVWTATIFVDNKVLKLGNFPFTEEGEKEAAKAYDAAAKYHFGEFANLNFK